MIISKICSKILAAALAVALTGCAPAAEQGVNRTGPGGNMTLYVTSDIHYLSESINDHGEAFEKFVASGDGKQLNYIDAIMDAFVYELGKTKPQVLIVSGDLTTNGEKASHEKLAEKFRQIEDNGTAVYVIPGNHDISNPYARGFKGDEQYVVDTVDAGGFSKIYADFGYKEAISKDEGSLSYLAAPSEGLWLLMLDTNQYDNNFALGFPQTDGQLSWKTLNWIKGCVDQAKGKGARIIAVMHHNLLNHSEVIRDGFTLNNNEELLKLFGENGLNLALSGHIHTQDISSYGQGSSKIYDIAANALSVHPNQYGIIQYTPGTGIDYTTDPVDVEGWAKDTGVTDTNLLNFKSYSGEYFGGFAYNMAYRRLAEEQGPTDEEKKLMAEVVKTLNIRYFAGTEELNAGDIIGSEGFRLWSDPDLPQSFLKNYVMSIVEDKDTPDNHLHIDIKNSQP